MRVTRRKKRIMGIDAVVVLDKVWADGKPEERTFDWYAQDKQGNVWYMGEDSYDYEHGHWVRNDGSWTAGVGNGKPGVIMLAHPRSGDAYRQEYSPATRWTRRRCSARAVAWPLRSAPSRARC